MTWSLLKPELVDALVFLVDNMVLFVHVISIYIERESIRHVLHHCIICIYYHFLIDPNVIYDRLLSRQNLLNNIELS